MEFNTTTYSLCFDQLEQNIRPLESGFFYIWLQHLFKKIDMAENMIINSCDN
jgi:hypothetical protein